MFSIPLSTILSILVVQLTLLIRIPLRLVIISSSSSSFTMSFLTQTGTTLLINLFQELQFWARLISNFFSASFSNPAEGNSVVPQMCVTNQYTFSPSMYSELTQQMVSYEALEGTIRPKIQGENFLFC